MGNLIKETPYSEITATLEVLDAQGVTREDLISVRKSRTLAKKIAEVIMASKQKVRETYKVVVDYGKSLAEMILLGNYGWFNDDINSKNFPLQGTGAQESELVLVHLNQSATSKEVLESLDSQGLAPAQFVHLLAFGAAYPELQRQFPIIALGSSFVDGHGDRGYPYLYCHGSRRRLCLYWGGDGHRGLCRFLAVGK